MAGSSILPIVVYITVGIPVMALALCLLTAIKSFRHSFLVYVSMAVAGYLSHILFIPFMGIIQS